MQVDALEDDVRDLLTAAGHWGNEICESMAADPRDEEAACRAAWNLLRERSPLSRAELHLAMLIVSDWNCSMGCDVLVRQLEAWSPRTRRGA